MATYYGQDTLTIPENVAREMVRVSVEQEALLKKQKAEGEKIDKEIKYGSIALTIGAAVLIGMLLYISRK